MFSLEVMFNVCPYDIDFEVDPWKIIMTTVMAMGGIHTNIISVTFYAIFKNGCLATSGATVGERNKLELMTSQNIKLRIICKDAAGIPAHLFLFFL